MAAVQNAIISGKEKLEKWLEQKNYFTDFLGKIEEKTKVKKLHLFLGRYIFDFTYKLRLCQSAMQAVVCTRQKCIKS
jgi:hypothetical protein